jgi:hypothetical protein
MKSFPPSELAEPHDGTRLPGPRPSRPQHDRAFHKSKNILVKSVFILAAPGMDALLFAIRSDLM